MKNYLHAFPSILLTRFNKTVLPKAITETNFNDGTINGYIQEGKLTVYRNKARHFRYYYVIDGNRAYYSKDGLKLCYYYLIDLGDREIAKGEQKIAQSGQDKKDIEALLESVHKVIVNGHIYPAITITEFNNTYRQRTQRSEVLSETLPDGSAIDTYTYHTANVYFMQHKKTVFVISSSSGQYAECANALKNEARQRRQKDIFGGSLPQIAYIRYEYYEDEADEARVKETCQRFRWYSPCSN